MRLEMAVAVEDGLPRRFANVHSNVEALRGGVVRQDQLARATE